MTTAPEVRVNNYVNKKNKSLDVLSKIFIIFEFVLGLNRFAVFGITKIIVKIVTCVYSVSFFGFVSYITIVSNGQFMQNVKLLQYAIYTIFGFVTRKKLQSFYKELEIFDNEVGTAPKITRDCLKIVLQAIFVTAFTIFTIYQMNLIIFVILHLIHVIENQYYGHLFHLIVQRLRSINCCIKTSLINAEVVKSTEVEKFSTNTNGIEIKMSKLMDFYYIIVKAYDLLTDAIKCQLLLIITISFLYTLLISYYVSEAFLFYNAPILQTLRDLSLVVLEILPLAAPCMGCDQIRAEVLKLRELLASKLYESKLDKRSRSAARSLLALTEARNLSFSLLRMMDISVSLPFSFLGLVATYLIILLQFEKVINPNSN